MRSRGAPDELTHRRWLAVQRVSEEYSTPEVADFLGVDPSTVRRWRAPFRDQRVHGLAARPVSGGPRKLTLIQEKIALRWRTESPLHPGFETALWTAPRRGPLIREEEGVLLHPRSLSAGLRDRGLTPPKPQRVPRARDPKAIAAWRESDGPRLPTKARGRDAWIALSDDRGLLRAPRARRTWSPRGPTPDRVQKSGPREKVSVAAALGLSPRRDRLGLDYHPGANGSCDNWSVTAVLEAMVPELTGRFVVVGDGGRMQKGDPIRALVDHCADRLVLEKLPPYAPRLNAVEPLWSWLQGERLSNGGPKDARERDARVIAELAAVREDQAFLRNLFPASDLPLPRALLS